MKRNQKGFTLAELLIVVAIIAVLVAISIPIFNSQLEKSRESTDIANLRSAKAEGLAAFLTDEAPLVTITNGARTYNDMWYNISSGKLQSTFIAVGKGTDAVPSGASYADASEYNYTGGNVVGQGIKVTATAADGVTVRFSTAS